ncbi:MAG: TetR/AcrR family transcriptional regulator [Acidimicrobiia bacterium]|nr:TetR/AcrR family transcriptional regulator [Acidimicrobiia bacterium]
MSRPTFTSAAERRARYLETALALFIEHGYNGVSMDTIVSAAGGSKATIYRYFDSKETLFSAIVDDLQTRMAAIPQPEDMAELPLADGLRQLGRATATAALSDRAIVLLRLASGEYNRFPELAQTLFDLAPGRSYERFGAYLQAKQARGEVVVDDAQIAAEQFLAGIVGHLQLRMLLGVGNPTTAEIERRVDAAVKMFLRTYAPNEP